MSKILALLALLAIGCQEKTCGTVKVRCEYNYCGDDAPPICSFPPEIVWYSYECRQNWWAK